MTQTIASLITALTQAARSDAKACGLAPLKFVASEMDVPHHTFAAWKYRGGIPVEHWPRFMDLCAKRGLKVTSDDLVAAHVGTATSQVSA